MGRRRSPGWMEGAGGSLWGWGWGQGCSHTTAFPAGIWRGTGSGRCMGPCSRSVASSPCCEYPRDTPWWAGGGGEALLGPLFPLLWARRGAVFHGNGFAPYLYCCRLHEFDTSSVGTWWGTPGPCPAALGPEGGFPRQQQPGAAGTEQGQRQDAAQKKLPMVRKQRGSRPAQSLLLASKSPKNISEECHKLCELALCVKP